MPAWNRSLSVTHVDEVCARLLSLKTVDFRSTGFSFLD